VTDQPRGTVTLFFSDVEGSTRLLHELGPEAYRDALADHRRLLRAAFQRHKGYEVDNEGDGFFVAFEDAADAAEAAAEAQAALAGGPTRVRIGLHTGTPILDPPKYVGREVHLAARIGTDSAPVLLLPRCGGTKLAFRQRTIRASNGGLRKDVRGIPLTSWKRRSAP